MFQIDVKPPIKSTIFMTLLTTSLITGCATQNAGSRWPAQQPNYSNQQNNGYNNNQIVYDERGVPSLYQVKQGDTVGTIANHYGIDYRQIAYLNNLDSEYTIYTEQWLRLWDSSTVNSNNGTYNPNVNNNTNYNNGNYNQSNSYDLNSAYQYPTVNPVIHNFNSDAGYYGMWFSGRAGDPVLSSKGGTVLYSGNGVDGFGNLVLIRHDDSDVTAYAHNKELLVREGEAVRTGQRIATMGQTGETNQVALEFQFRRNGSPIDPLSVITR